MSEEQALYVRDGDAFVGTGCTKGSWHANGQSGGAVLALLGHVLEDVPTLAPMSLSRLTVDIVRPVPLGERLHVEPVVIREGKRIQVVDLTVTTAEGAHVQARALRLRDADHSATDWVPPSTTDHNPAATLPPPEELASIEDRPGYPDFLRFGAEMRRTTEPIDGVNGLWVRLRVPVVAGEPVRATSRVALPMDCVNLIGASLVSFTARAINPDVSAHVYRPPVGEWTALTGNTHISAAVGHGMSVAMLSDVDGVLGVTSTSQLVDPPD